MWLNILIKYSWPKAGLGQTTVFWIFVWDRVVPYFTGSKHKHLQAGNLPLKITFDFFTVKILVRALKLQKLTLQSMPSFEVLALYHNTDSRSCNLYPACGISVAVENFVFVKKETSLIHGRL